MSEEREEGRIDSRFVSPLDLWDRMEHEHQSSVVPCQCTSCSEHRCGSMAWVIETVYTKRGDVAYQENRCQLCKGVDVGTGISSCCEANDGRVFVREQASHEDDHIAFRTISGEDRECECFDCKEFGCKAPATVIESVISKRGEVKYSNALCNECAWQDVDVPVFGHCRRGAACYESSKTS